MRRRLADISGALEMRAKGIHTDTWIALGCVIATLVISVLPLNVGRSETELYLCFMIPAVALTGVLAGCIRNVRFRFSWIDALVLGWYAYAMSRLWLDATYPAAGFTIRATLMCILYLAMRLLLSGCRLPGKGIAILLILFATVEAAMGYIQVLSGASRHHLYLATGSFLNSGPYSIYLALGAVSLCALRKSDTIGYILLMTLAVPLALTMSRAAFLAIFVCLTILYHDRIKGWRQWGMLVAAALLGAATLYFLKSSSADGRGIINFIGIHCLADNPLCGSGIGSFFHGYALKTAEISTQSHGIDFFSVDVIDYAFNDLLLVGVEQGLIGLAFAAALTVMVLYRLWPGCKPLFLTALSLLVISLLSYPFELLPYQIIGVTITSYAATNAGTEKDREHPTRGHSFEFISKLKILAVPTPLFLAAYVCHYSINQRLEAEKEYRMFAGIQDSAFIKDNFALFPYLQDNKHFLFDFAKILSKAHRYNDSNDILRRGAMISNDPMFLVRQGNNYRDMGALEEAEDMYLKAWHTMPNRIYPLYRLMTLHRRSGNRDKAMEYAEKVAVFKEKIPSPAVNDMKREAREIINENYNNKIEK